MASFPALARLHLQKGTGTGGEMMTLTLTGWTSAECAAMGRARAESEKRASRHFHTHQNPTLAAEGLHCHHPEHSTRNNSRTLIGGLSAQ